MILFLMEIKMIEKIPYGKVGPDEVYLFKMDNGKGLSAEIITYGGILRTLTFDGVDVVLGRDSLEEYMDNAGCLGALIGRNSNIYPLSSVRGYVDENSIYKAKGEIVKKA